MLVFVTNMLQKFYNYCAKNSILDSAHESDFNYINIMNLKKKSKHILIINTYTQLFFFQHTLYRNASFFYSYVHPVQGLGSHSMKRATLGDGL